MCHIRSQTELVFVEVLTVPVVISTSVPIALRLAPARGLMICIDVQI